MFGVIWPLRRKVYDSLWQERRSRTFPVSLLSPSIRLRVYWWHGKVNYRTSEPCYDGYEHEWSGWMPARPREREEWEARAKRERVEWDSAYAEWRRSVKCEVISRARCSG